LTWGAIDFKRRCVIIRKSRYEVPAKKGTRARRLAGRRRESLLNDHALASLLAEKLRHAASVMKPRRSECPAKSPERPDASARRWRIRGLSSSGT
jgi:hypothetical protein